MLPPITMVNGAEGFVPVLLSAALTSLSLFITTTLLRSQVANTYIRLRVEFVYLAVLLDGFSRKVVGWALERTLTSRLAIAALREAIAKRQPRPGLIHYSDRGDSNAVPCSRPHPRWRKRRQSFMKDQHVPSTNCLNNGFNLRETAGVPI